MPRAQNLMGVGFAPIAALAMGGSNVRTLDGVGIGQSGARDMGSADVILGTTTAGQTAFLLPDMNVGETIVFYNTSSTAALLFPPTGAQINALGANNSFSAAQNRSVMVMRVAADRFLTLYGS